MNTRLSQQDMWSQWLLNRRFGGDLEKLKAILAFLYPVRDRVLQHASIGEQEMLLDVGCGDGLIAFGALQQSKTVRVIFSDISPALLDEARAIAQEAGVLDRSQFVCASAEDLSAIGAETVNAVTTRSVLIYIADKRQTFKEFYCVLKPGGRLSIFEPINSFRYPELDHVFWGYDVTPVAALAKKVKAVYQSRQSPGSDPMLDFDERRLLELAEEAGFKEIHLELQAEIKPNDEPVDWEGMLRGAPNPKAPTLAEAMQEALAPAEQTAFTGYLRSQIEGHRGKIQLALAYLWAIK